MHLIINTIRLHHIHIYVFPAVLLGTAVRAGHSQVHAASVQSK